jgi:hypothetical protein
MRPDYRINHIVALNRDGAKQLSSDLPGREQRGMEVSLKRLDCDRTQALEPLEEGLCHSYNLKLLSGLHKWQHNRRSSTISASPLLAL